MKLVLWQTQIKSCLNIYSLFGIVFLFNLMLIFQGLDVTDFGYHLTNQITLVTSSDDGISTSPMIILSDFVGGLWLILIGNPSVLWARLGGVLLLGCNAALVYSILSSYFQKQRVFVVVLISTLFLTMHSSIYIHYFTFPAFLLILELWIFNKILQEKQGSKSRVIWSFLLGFMTIPVILSRFTLILIFVIPLLFIAYYHICRRDPSDAYGLAVPVILGVIFSAILFAIIFWYLGILNDYIMPIVSTLAESAGGEMATVNKSHGMVSLIRGYLVDYLIVFIGAGVVLAGLYILSLVNDKYGRMFAGALLITATLIGVFLLTLFIPSGLIGFVAVNLLKVAVALIILLCALFLYVDHGRSHALTLLVIAGMAVMIINPVGSNCGILKSLYGMWLILPLIILCTYKIRGSIRYPPLSSVISLLDLVLIAILIFSVFFQVTDVYRDDQNRLNLNTEFTHPSLKGIYSTPERVSVVDEVLVEIERYSDKGDELLIVNGMPLFYYLTGTNDIFGKPWLFLKPIEKIKSDQQELITEEHYPELFVFSKVNTCNRYWPDADDSFVGESYQEKFDYLYDEYVNKLDYSLLWENSAFAIYAK